MNAYDPPPDSGELRQGEVVGPVWDHQSQELPILLDEGQAMTSIPIEHRRLLVLTNDCDLLWDFQARFADEESRLRMQPETEAVSAYIIPGVVCCEMFEKPEITELGMKAATWNLATKNNHARYHYLEEALVTGSDPERSIPEVVLDFKRVTRFPPSQLYAGIRTSHVRRMARLPEIYTLDVVQRFSSYQSRVALPDVR